MTRALILSNRQRDCPVDLSFWRRILRGLLAECAEVEAFALGVHLVGAPEMTRLNQAFLQHRGVTDVITFDYTKPAGPGDLARRRSRPTPPGRTRAGRPGPLQGEIFICLDEALRQAHRYRTTWQSELTRYAVHGVLHLLGYDDLRPLARRSMKRAEDRWLRALSRRFPLAKLARVSTVSGSAAGRKRRPASRLLLPMNQSRSQYKTLSHVGQSFVRPGSRAVRSSERNRELPMNRTSAAQRATLNFQRWLNVGR